MRFIVTPKKVRNKYGNGGKTTMCALCSEDPRFCGEPI